MPGEEEGLMTQFIAQLLMLGGISSFRQDEAVARQGVMQHQLNSGLLVLSFIRDATEMSIPESFAVQGLSAASLPRDAAGINLARQTPNG